MIPDTRSDLAALARTLLPEVRPHGRLLARAYLFELAAILTGVLAPWPLKLIIDHGLQRQPLPAWLAGLDAILVPAGQIVAFSTVFVGLMVLGAAAVAMGRVTLAQVRERLAVALRDRMLGHLQTLPPTIRISHKSGELVLRLVGDVDLVVKLLTRTLPLLFRFAATGLFTIVAMLWLAPLEAVLIVGFLPALCLLVLRYGPRVTAAARRKRRREGEVAGLAQEIIRGLPVIQALGGDRQVRARFAELNAASLRAGVEETRLSARLEWSLEGARGLAIGIVTGGGALLALGGILTVGELTVLAAYVAQLLKPIDKANDLAEAASRGVAAAERMSALLAQAPLVTDRAGALVLGPVRGVLELREVGFGYPDPQGRSVAVLRGASMTLQPGRLTVLIGRSGAGKSTIMSLLVRLFDPTSGEILLDGHPLPMIALRSLRSQIAIMTQDLHLLAGSLRETLAPPDRAVPDDALWRVLELVAMTEFVRALPNGLDTHLGEDGLNLSGGQRQRLSLARALLLDRPILLLDEPLANVDEISARVILAAIAEVKRERTCLAITHEPMLLEHADEVYQLDGGALLPKTPHRRPKVARQTA